MIERIRRLFIAVLLVTLVGGTAIASAAAPDPVWLDAPPDGWRLEAGQYVLVAHSAGRDVNRLTLWVDGAAVDQGQPATNSQGLAVAQLPWTATTGMHRLQVVDSQQSRSSEITVIVGYVFHGATATPTAPTPSPSASPTAGLSTKPPTTKPPSTRPSATPSAGVTLPPLRPTTRPLPLNPPVLQKAEWQNNPAYHPSGTCTKAPLPVLTASGSFIRSATLKLTDQSTGAVSSFDLTSSSGVFSVTVPVLTLLPSNPIGNRTFTSVLVLNGSVSNAVPDLVVRSCPNLH